MEAETAKMKMKEQSRGEPIALIYEMAKEIRELKAEIERLTQPPTTSQYSSQPLSRDFKSATEKKRRRSKKKGAKPGYEKQERRLVEKLLKRTFKGLGRNLLDRYRKYRNSLFIFLRRIDVPAHNHACERVLHPSLIHRKVLGSFRSDWGAQAYAALVTILNTAKRTGQSAFQKLVQLMGTPVLHFLSLSI